jgi:nitrogen fixation/metabolism regulation signal transduction histidine kinase
MRAHLSLAGRFSLLAAAVAVIGAGVGALASALGASGLGIGLAVLSVAVPLGFLGAARAARPIERAVGALRDGVRSLRDGDYSLRLAVGRRDEVGELVEAYNAVVDQLARERGELRQRELLLDTMLDSSAVATVLANAAGRVVYASRAARRLFAEGRPLAGAVLGDVVAPMPEPLRQALLAGGESLVTVAVAGADEVFHVSRRSFELNARRHLLLLVQRMTPELRRQEVALWKKVIRIIGHELSNSLAPIRSLVHSARIIRSGGGDDARLDGILDTIDDSAARVHRFVDGYARFARLPAPRREAMDLGAFLEQLRRIEPFALATPPPARPASLDAAQMQQALLNLLRNAREAGSAAGDITVAVQELPGGELAIRVADRGAGMDEETMTKALLPFYSSKKDGSGLGLALSREIVEAHGGTLQLASRAGGGLEVTCRIPPPGAAS